MNNKVTRTLCTTVLTILVCLTVTQPAFAQGKKGFSKKRKTIETHVTRQVSSSAKRTPTREVVNRQANGRIKLSPTTRPFGVPSLAEETRMAERLTAQRAEFGEPLLHEQLWVKLHDGKLPIHGNFEALLEDWNKYADVTNPDRVVYLRKKSLAPSSKDVPPGLYYVWDAPTNSMAFISESGRVEKVRRTGYFSKVLVQSVDGGPRKVMNTSSEFMRANPLRKPLPESFVKANPTSAEELWQAIGGKKEYTQESDLYGDLSLYFENADPSLLPKKVGQASRKFSDGTVAIYDIYETPVKGLSYLDEYYQLQKGEDSVVIVFNKSASSIKMYKNLDDQWNAYTPDIQILPRNFDGGGYTAGKFSSVEMY